MNKIYILLLLTLLNATAFAQKNINDVKRYGLKGKVKVMEETRFPFTKMVDGEYVVTDTVFYNVDRYTFDAKGQLVSLENIHNQVAGKRSSNSSMTKFFYVGDKISGSESFDASGRKINVSTIKWEKNNKYVDRSEDNEFKNEVVHLLDNDMRNKEVINRRFSKRGGKLYSQVISTYTYDSDGRPIREVIVDSMTKNTYHFEMKTLAQDDKNNVLKVLFTTNKTDKMPDQLLIYSYEYYQ